MNGWHRDTGDYVATVEAPLSAGANAPEVTDDLEASDSVRDLLRRHAEGLYRFYDLGMDYICLLHLRTERSAISKCPPLTLRVQPISTNGFRLEHPETRGRQHRV